MGSEHGSNLIYYHSFWTFCCVLTTYLAVSLDTVVCFIPEVREMSVARQEQVGRDQHADVHVDR